ncbi:MAG: TM0106 family RecB-like putative nuclease [Chloroflexi bacterium]|nr:TM0106 family RecB-like putative nuclease [Chloroflexota bacterium]
MTTDINTIFRTMTAQRVNPVIKADAVETFVGHPLNYWCDLYAPEENKDPMTDFQQMLFDFGQEHQAKSQAQLVGKATQVVDGTELERFQKTLLFMAQGVEALANMPLFCLPLGLQGRPDLLVRVDGVQSRFGNHAYIVYEIKSAKNIRTSHRLQAAVYNRMLGQVQGWEPPEFFIVGQDMEPVSVEMSEVADDLDDALDAMRAVARGKTISPCYNAARWPWEGQINNLAIQANDVSLVSGVGYSTRNLLVEAGFRTVANVALAHEEVLATVKGIGAAKAHRISTSARALTQKNVVPRRQVEKPLAGETQVFLDLEGSLPGLDDEGMEVNNYLIGNVVRRNGSQAEFVPFFADSPSGEGENLNQFLEWAFELPDPVFYHWHDYERTHLRKMSERYGMDGKLASNVLNRLEDLRPLVVNSFAFPTYGEGLKPIAKHLGFSWRQDDVDAMGSVALYMNYTRSAGRDTQAKNRILTYNEDDCFATMHVFDWFMQQASSPART